MLSVTSIITIKAKPLQMIWVMLLVLWCVSLSLLLYLSKIYITHHNGVMEPAPHLTSDLWSPIGHSDVVEMGGGVGV